MENGIPYDKDPYEELCQNPEERPIYKKVLLISINADDETEALWVTNKELREEGFKGECLKLKYLKECLDKFKKYHQPIADFLHHDMGLALQYEDSCIADEVLTRMVREKIPCLPVHDSFIVPVENEDILRQVMTEAYQKLIGRDRNKPPFWQ